MSVATLNEADIVIKNAMVLTMDEALQLYERADIVIAGDKIVSISPETQLKGRITIDASGKLAMPGLINTHTHAAMTMMRGIADDLPLDVWWKKFIFPVEKKLLDPEFIRIGVSLAAIEMLKSGTTTFSDMYYFEGSAAEVCKKIGIRAVLGEAVLDFPSPDSLNADETLKITEQLHEKWGTDPIIHLSICPHAPYTCGKENLLKSKKLAEKLGLPLHMHVAETVGEVAEFRLKYGVSPVQYLENIGFLDERVIAVHCVQVNHQDMEIFRERKVKVSHCQESNMKLASGSPPIVEMQDKGIVVGLGTDGAASNNNLDMFDEMDAVAKYHKAVRGDPTIMDAKTVLRMATRDGAKVLQRENLGKLVVGATADVIIIDLNRPHLTPLYNIYSHLVYSAGGGEVDTVIINGRLVMENRTILTIDEGEVLDRARHLAERIKNEVKNI